MTTSTEPIFREALADTWQQMLRERWRLVLFGVWCATLLAALGLATAQFIAGDWQHASGGLCLMAAAIYWSLFWGNPHLIMPHVGMTLLGILGLMLLFDWVPQPPTAASQSTLICQRSEGDTTESGSYTFVCEWRGEGDLP